MKQPNVLFYMGREEPSPHQILVKDIHRKWIGDREMLEYDHDFIQWLFPIAEKGMNYNSEPLMEHEAKTIRETPALQNLVIQSYELMLDHYGLVLADVKSGLVKRNPETWRERLRELNRSHHNFLRITRILKCLGLMGLEHYKLPLLNHLILEIFEEETLVSATRSCLDYWVPTLRLKSDENIIRDVLRRVGYNGRIGQGDELHKSGSWSVREYTPTLKDWGAIELPDRVQEFECDPFASFRSRRRRSTVPSSRDNNNPPYPSGYAHERQ